MPKKTFMKNSNFKKLRFELLWNTWKYSVTCRIPHRWVSNGHGNGCGGCVQLDDDWQKEDRRERSGKVKELPTPLPLSTAAIGYGRYCQPVPSWPFLPRSDLSNRSSSTKYIYVHIGSASLVSMEKPWERRWLRTESKRKQLQNRGYKHNK